MNGRTGPEAAKKESPFAARSNELAHRRARSLRTAAQGMMPTWLRSLLAKTLAWGRTTSLHDTGWWIHRSSDLGRILRRPWKVMWNGQRAPSAEDEGGSTGGADGDHRNAPSGTPTQVPANRNPSDSAPGRRFGLYVVGVFDILGQKRSLYELPGTHSAGAIQVEEVREYLRETVGRVLQIRRLFDHQFRVAVQSVENIAGSQGATAHQKQILTPSLRHWGMSDSYVVAIPPPDDREFSEISRLIDIFRMLDVSAAVWLFAMSEDLPIRGGIELGYAVDVGDQEIYGHALAEALRLESTIAQYPRIVVGKNLTSLLNGAVGRAARRSAQEASMAKKLAEYCWKCVGNDEDGQVVVDVAGATSATQIREQRPDVLPAVVSNVRRQLQRHKDARDTTLVERYEWLQRRLAQPS